MARKVLFKPQVHYLKSLKEILNANNEISLREKLTIYQALFPPRAGLSDIHYWHNDFEIRKQVNELISISNKIISNYLLDR